MSRELDPTGMAQLNRSISTDSLSSISSIANNFGQDFTVGQLEVTLEFEPSRYPGQGTGLLHITLHQGKDLLEKEEGDFPGCFIRVSLGPEEINVGVTRVRKGLSRPVVLTWIRAIVLLIFLCDLGVVKVHMQAKATAVGGHAEWAQSYRKRSNLLKIQKCRDNLLRIYTCKHFWWNSSSLTAETPPPKRSCPGTTNGSICSHGVGLSLRGFPLVGADVRGVQPVKSNISPSNISETEPIHSRSIGITWSFHDGVVLR